MEYKKKDPKIIILTGKAEAGKNKVASIINTYYQNQNIRSINIAYASYLKEYAKNILNWDGNEQTKPREFLQSIGIDLIKNKIDPQFLINRIKQDIEVYSYFYDIIIISDARFINEIEEIKTISEKVTVIKILRGKNSLTEKQKTHITETALDEYQKYDYIINNKEIENLTKQIEKILEVI